ncbi:MAG: alpha/beta hydrolase [Spirochaetaceae bacterium]
MKLVKKIIVRVLLVLITIGLLIILSAGGILTLVIVNGRADFEELDVASNYGVNSSELDLLTSDGFNIKAYEVKAENPKGYIILLSGIYSPSVTTFYGYSKMFSELGYSSLLIEMRAHGESSGDKIMLGYTEEHDVYAGVDYIDSNYSNNIPIIIMGTSMGGTVAINSIANNRRINGVIAQSAFSSWEENMMDQFQTFGAPRLLTLAQVPFTKFLLAIKYGIKNIKNTPGNNIAKIDPDKILLMHSENDSQVTFNNFKRLSNLITGPFESFVVAGDKHLILEDEEEFINPELNVEYYKTIKSFLSKI